MPEFDVRKIRIVVADDHAIVRESLSLLLATQKDFEIEGSASNGQQALDMVQRYHPDVLVLDLFMPDFDGFEVLRTLDRSGNRVATVVLTGSESDTDYAQAVCLSTQRSQQSGIALFHHGATENGRTQAKPQRMQKGTIEVLSLVSHCVLVDSLQPFLGGERISPW